MYTYHGFLKERSTICQRKNQAYAWNRKLEKEKALVRAFSSNKNRPMRVTTYIKEEYKVKEH